MSVSDIQLNEGQNTQTSLMLSAETRNRRGFVKLSILKGGRGGVSPVMTNIEKIKTDAIRALMYGMMLHLSIISIDYN